MKRYTACVERSGSWWAISVPEVKGVHTQARRLDQVADRARDAIAGVLDVPMRSFDVEIEVQMPVAIDKAVQDALDRRRLAEETGQAASQAMARAAGLLVAKGLTVRDAGHMLHISHQRVGQVVSATSSSQKKAKKQSGGAVGPAR